MDMTGRRGRAWYLFLLLKGMSKTLPKSRRISSTSLFPKQAWIGPPCANLIMAPSLALPRVFQRISVIVEPSPWTRTLLNGNRTRLPVTSSSKYLSKLHVLQSVEHLTCAERLGPNGLKFEKQTTPGHHSWRRFVLK